MANALTVCRILLIPLFLCLILAEPVPDSLAWALLVLGVSALTDVADGWIARRQGQVSTVGILLDPLADKLTLVSVLLALASRGWVPFWMAGLFLGKEALQVLGAAWFVGRRGRVVAARWPGKASTVLLYGGVVAVMVGWEWGLALVLAGILLSVAAGLYYGRLALKPESDPPSSGPA